MLTKKENNNSHRLFKNHEDSLKYRMIIFLVGSVGLTILSAIVGIIVYASVIGSKKQTEELTLQYSTITNSVSYALILLALFFVLIPEIKYVFNRFKNIKNIFVGLIFGVLLIIATSAYSSFINIFRDLENNQNEAVLEDMVVKYPLISFIVLSFMGPITEELTYRYGLFDGIRRKSRLLAYIITIIIFAFIHFDFTSKTMDIELLNLPSYLIAAALLSYAYDKYGLESSVVAHVFNNMVMCIIVMRG